MYLWQMYSCNDMYHYMIRVNKPKLLLSMNLGTYRHEHIP